MEIVKCGNRFTVDGYLRSDMVDGKEFVRVRTFAIYNDESEDNIAYKEAMKTALEILRKSRDLDSAKQKIEELLKS